MVYTGKEGLDQIFVLTSGASREKQFDDFWKIKIGLSSSGRTVTQEKLELTERGDFTSRNALTAVAVADNVVIFGGQDSQQERLFNDLFVFNLTERTLK